MARPRKKLLVLNSAQATASTTIAAGGNITPKFTQGWPTGDDLIHEVNLRYSGNLNLTTSGAGSIIARGGLTNIRSIWFSTPQHGVIVNGLDGLALHTVDYFRRGVRPPNTDISSAGSGTPTFDYHVPLSFRDEESIRPENTSLDMFRVSYAELIMNIGGATDYISGGTYSTEVIQVLNVEIDAAVDPGPIGATDVPAFKPYLDILRMPVNQTQTAFQIVLPYGGRLVKRYYMAQRNGTTLLELANTVVGVNDQDRVSMVVGGYPWMQRLEWLALQDANVREFRLANGIPTGCAALNFAPKDSGGYDPAELLGLNSVNGATPLTEIDVDTTSVSNGQLWIYTEALTPIPVDAQRQTSAAATKA